MKNSDKTELFETMPVPKAITKLAVPTVVGCLVMVLYSLADTYFVGMLNDPIQNAAVTLAAPIILLFNAVNNLFGVGGSSMMSRALGAKNYKLVKESSAFSFWGCIFSGLLFSLVMTVFKYPIMNLLGADSTTVQATGEYMFWTVTLGAIPSILNVVMGNLVRAEGCAMNATIGSMSGCLLNIILDPVFILPSMLNMGASGAGLATLISNTFACLYFFCFLWAKRGKTYVCIDIKAFTLRREVFIGVLGVGVPAAIQNMLNVTGMTILNNFTADFGSEAVAAMGIAHKTTMIPMYISMGITQGVLPLIGYNFASGNKKRFKESVLDTLYVGTAIIIVCTIAFFAGSKGIIRLFMENVNIVNYGGAFMKGMSLALPFLAIDFTVVGIFQACGMGKRSLIFAILRKVVLEIPALFVLNIIWPLYGLAYAQLFAEFVLAIASVLLIVKILKPMEKEGIEETIQ